MKDSKKSRVKGGFEGSGGMLHDNSNKRQHHTPPMGHGEVSAKAGRDSNKQASPPPMGSIHSNIGHGEAKSKAARMSGMGGSSTGGYKDSHSESEMRMKGKMATSEKAMSGGGKMPGIAQKASGYRVTSSAAPAPKAKRQKGS